MLEAKPLVFRAGCRTRPAGLLIPLNVNGFPVNRGAVVVIVGYADSTVAGVFSKVGSSFFGGPDIGWLEVD